MLENLAALHSLYENSHSPDKAREIIQSLPPSWNNLIKKYQLCDFFREQEENSLEKLDQLQCLVFNHVLDPSAHRHLLHFLKDLYLEKQIDISPFEPMLNEALPAQDSVRILGSERSAVECLLPIEWEINNLLALKNRFLDANFKQLIAIRAFYCIKENEIFKKSLANAETLLENNEFSEFYFLLREICYCIFQQDTGENPSLASLWRMIDETENDAIALAHDAEKFHHIAETCSTPPAILKLLAQGGFQDLNTEYCSAIAYLVATYIVIHHVVTVHASEGLTLQQLFTELSHLISVPAFEAGDDIATNIINLFFASDYYKKQITSPNYQYQFTVTGPLNFSVGDTFNRYIAVDLKKERYEIRPVEIRQLHCLLNIALHSVLKNKAKYKIQVHYAFPNSHLIQTVALLLGDWNGVQHVAVKTKEGFVNAPRDHFELIDFVYPAPVLLPIEFKAKNILIRKMTKADFKEMEFLASSISIDQFDPYFTPDFSFVAIHENNLQIEGYIFARRKENEFFVDDMAVRPNLRKQGIGSALLNTVINRAVQYETVIEELFLRLRIKNNNQYALYFFEKQGFLIQRLNEGYSLGSKDLISVTASPSLFLSPSLTDPFAKDEDLLAENNPSEELNVLANAVQEQQSSMTDLERFKKIYQALYLGQTSLFKREKKYQNINELERVKEYAVRFPKSRTAKAWQLTEQFKEINDINLVKTIHRYCYQLSSSFFFFKQTRNFLDYEINTLPNPIEPRSRTGKIIAALH